MIKEEDIKELIESFKQYRDMIVPVQANIHSFLETYEAMREDVSVLNKSFDGNIQKNLESIYTSLSTQAEKSNKLVYSIDEFVGGFSKYTQKLNALNDKLEKLDLKLNTLSSIEEKAENQIAKLDAIIEEKQKTYNIKELEKQLATYNENVEKVSKFINEDVVSEINKNSSDIALITKGHEDIAKRLDTQKSGVDKLIDTYKETNLMLRKIIEKEDVNEAYLFEILDKWAENRKVKTKIKD